MDAPEITLIIEGNKIKCKKEMLIDNSDYFRAMFEGNFIERNQDIVTLHGVDFRSFSIILKYCLDETYVIEEEDLLIVLHTACMLQFIVIRLLCIDWLTEILSVKNCIYIWIMAEPLDLKALYLKAKNLSLVEFPVLKEANMLLELNIKQLHEYLANVFLFTKSELDVFTACMKWWYENSLVKSLWLPFSEMSEVYYYFLNFVDFQSLSEADLGEIMTYPDIYTDNNINTLISAINGIRRENSRENNEDQRVNTLLNGKRRIKNSFPCILIDGGHICDNCKSKNLEGPTKQCVATGYRRIMLYDPKIPKLKTILHIGHKKLENLEGFHILGYKELIFLFGGEFFWGRGNWSNNFWAYDTIRGRWERKTKMPYGRRHFESCVVNDIVYIVGGTGNFRVLQDNMFWYCYKQNQWSNVIKLPCTGRQLKCCEYKDKLFLLSINHKSGYLYNSEAAAFTQFKICDTNNLVSSYPEKFVVFSYEDFIYIKGSSIIQLRLHEDTLEVIKSTFLRPISNFDTMESVLCNGILYTIYKRITDDVNSVIFEKFDVSTYTSDTIMEYVMEATSNVNLWGELCKFSKGTRLFHLGHHSMVEENTYITDISL